MKHISIIIVCLIAAMVLPAQDKLTVHKSDNTIAEFLISEIEDMSFSGDQSVLNLLKKDNVTSSFNVSEIDSISFRNEAIATDAVKITYYNGAVYVTNPYADKGVSITTEGEDVIINSTVTDTELQYVISGTTDNGSLKIYSTYKFNLMLNGADITNNDGAAVNIQSSKKITVTLIDGTINKLTDSSSYTEVADEDMKATLFSEGQLNFEGNGTLYVQGNCKHAICSDDYIRIKSGNIIVTGSVKDGIHANDYFRMDGGTLDITATSDGIECEKGYIQINDGNITINSGDDGITASYKTDTTIASYVEINGGAINITTNNQKGAGIKSKISYVTINNGTLDIKVQGIASKALSSGGDMTIINGDINLTTTGNAYYDTSELDTSSASGIKCDGKLYIVDGTITISSSGSGGKGISADGELVIDGGTINVTTTGNQYVYDSNNDTAAKAIKSDSNVTINGGHIIIKTSKTEAEGLESKATMTINGGTIEIDAYDDGINASDHIQINGGTIYVNSQVNDGIDSNGTLSIAGGIIISAGAANPEGGIDCDQSTFKVTGGIIIGIGGSTSTPTASVSNQRSVVYSAGSVTSGQFIQITSSNGDALVFKVPRAYSSMTMLFSSPDLVSGTTYTINKGGSVSGGTEFHGLYTGATYSGGSKANTFDPTNMVTTVGSSGGPRVSP